MTGYREAMAVVLSECEATLQRVEGKRVEELIASLEAANRVFFVGTGRVLLALQSISTRLRHVGLDTYHVGQTSEPPIAPGDLLVVGSGSGESIFPVAIAHKAKAFGIKIVHIGSNPASSLTSVTDLFIRIPAATRRHVVDEVVSKQAMTSLFEQCLLLFGDIVANILIERRGLSQSALWQRHANLE